MRPRFPTLQNAKKQQHDVSKPLFLFRHLIGLLSKMWPQPSSPMTDSLRFGRSTTSFVLWGEIVSRYWPAEGSWLAGVVMFVAS